MNLRNIISILFCLIMPNLIAFFSLSSESLVLNGIPLIFYCIALSFIVHWIVFIPSYLNKTEKFFDFTGMITYLSVIIFALYSKYNLVEEGKVDFESSKLLENAQVFIRTILRARPASVKGTYVKKITISSTMGPGIKIDTNSVTL